MILYRMKRHAENLKMENMNVSLFMTRKVLQKLPKWFTRQSQGQHKQGLQFSKVES